MTEGAPRFENKEMQISDYLRLAIELSERTEALPFTSIDPAVYAKIKEGEENPDPDYPDTTTPIDTRIVRCTTHGIKVVLGKNPQSGNVYILPADSDNIEDDGLFPRQLEIDPGTDPELKKLIEADKHKDW